MPVTELDCIESESEAEYLDNGGCLSVERRDHYYTKVVDYARRLEQKLKYLGELSYLNEKRKRVDR